MSGDAMSAAERAVAFAIRAYVIAEREACAALAEGAGCDECSVARDIAAAIRARGRA